MARILVIDDDPDLLLFIQSVLQGSQHEVVLASNGLEGISQVEQHPPHLIITDIIMPEMDGIEVIVDVRHHHPDIPIIAMSGGGRIMDADFVLKAARNFHVQDALPKPFTRQALLALVSHILGKATPARLPAPTPDRGAEPLLAGPSPTACWSA